MEEPPETQQLLDGCSIPARHLQLSPGWWSTTAQLSSPTNEWTLEVSRACRLRRVGDLLSAEASAKATAKAATKAAANAAANAAATAANAAATAAATSDSMEVGGCADGSAGRLRVGGSYINVLGQWKVTAGLSALEPADITATATTQAEAGEACGDVVARKASGGVAPGGASDLGSSAKSVTAAMAIQIHNIPRGTSLEVRSWREGDRFHPVWRTSPISVASFLRGQGVPLEQRRRVPLLVRAGSAEVLAVFTGAKAGEQVGHVALGFQEIAEAEGGVEGEALWVNLDA